MAKRSLSKEHNVTGQTLVVDGGWTLQSPLPPDHPDLPEYSSQLR
jgi:hypothetical protein